MSLRTLALHRNYGLKLRTYLGVDWRGLKVESA